MNIGLVEPSLGSQARGNAVSAQRWAQGLERRGHRVRRLVPDDLGRKGALEGLDILHAHHAFRSGPQAAKAAEQADLPWVLSIGGTDLDLDDQGKLDPRAADAFRRCRLVIGPNWDDAEKITAALGQGVAFQRVRRGVVLPPRPLGVRSRGLRGLLAGGIREVKGQDVALDWIDALRERGVECNLIFAGPVVEEDYAAAFARRIERREDIAWLGVVEFDRMPRVFARSDFLMNSSRLEGGSNAILEAWAVGRPVVARNVPGNREMLADAPPSVAHLVDDSSSQGLDALAAWLQRLAGADAVERSRRAEVAREFVRAHHGVEAEVDELLRAYERARG